MNMIRSTNRNNFNGKHKTRTEQVCSVTLWNIEMEKKEKQNEIDSLYFVNVTLSNSSGNGQNDVADWIKLTEMLRLLSGWMTHAYQSVGILMRIYIHIRNKQYRLVCVYIPVFRSIFSQKDINKKKQRILEKNTKAS